jgi:hypothetical protein
MMPRTLLSLLLLVCLASGAVAGEPSAIAFSDPKTGIALPAKLGPLTYRGVKHYEQSALGVSVRYEGEPLVKADIFIYDLGKKNLGTGLKSPAVQPHFRQVKWDIYTAEKMGSYTSLSLVSEREIALQTPQGEIPALGAVFTYRQAEGPGSVYTGMRVSHLVLTAYRDSFLKIRFTYPENDKARGDLAFQQFMADLGRQLK